VFDFLPTGTSKKRSVMAVTIVVNTLIITCIQSLKK
jgi:hypothetical protein